MKKYLLFMCCAACLLAACEKPVYEGVDGGEDDDPSVVPGDGEQIGEVLWTENDTARFYLSGVEVSDVVLTDCPTPSLLVTDPRYRLPTRLEVAQTLKNVDVPEDYWQSGQRILCYDSPQHDGIKIGSTLYGSGNYYTFVPHGTITKAGYKTQYCILPIHTERLSKQDGHVSITVDDEWK